ncbi:MAG: calcium-binding EGF-like domain-containing protein [Myxococcales bacterium]
MAIAKQHLRALVCASLLLLASCPKPGDPSPTPPSDAGPGANLDAGAEAGPCAGQTCSGHGTCAAADGGGASCTCESGYMPRGLACVLDVDLPVNTWTLLPGKVSRPYRYSSPVYSPSRGQVLHWGRSGAEGWRNDVLAFDVSTLSWVSDGNGAPEKELADAQREGTLLGVAITGTAGMLPGGTPAPSTTAAAGVWDSKRNEVVYPLAGMTFSYDPTKRTWRDFKAANTPLLYGPGAGYDPINDELVVFPHFGARNRDLVPSNGNVIGHLGTHVYSFQENAWRRTSQTFGSPEVRAARSGLLGVATHLSRAVDGAWALRRAGSAATPAEVKQALAEAKAALDAVSLPAGTAASLGGVATPLAEATSAAAADGWDATLQAGGRALWALDALLDGALRVEPPARAGAPLVYLPAKKSLLLFGGHDGLVRQDLKVPENKGGEPGRRNDTWLYDCTTRQWREVSKSQRPPKTLWPEVVFDPASGLTLLVTRTGNPWDASAAGTVTLWGFDPATEEWQKLHEQAWPGKVGGAAYTGWGTIIQEVVLDERAALLLLLQVLEDGTGTSQETYALKLDVSQMKRSPAMDWTALEPIRPHGPVPADDPAVVGRLQSLPANSWVHMHPKNEGPERQWGNAACDPVRGHVYYFGGGHSTYQVNDVAIYAPGVNAWFYGVGDHNDWMLSRELGRLEPRAPGRAQRAPPAQHLRRPRRAHVLEPRRGEPALGSPERDRGASALRLVLRRGPWRGLARRADRDEQGPGRNGALRRHAPGDSGRPGPRLRRGPRAL